MTTRDEARDYMKRYKNLLERAEYLNNKITNVHSIRYDTVPTHNAKPQKNANDYIQMKEEYENEMHMIRDKVEQIKDLNYRDVLFYRYIEMLDVYTIANMLDRSDKTIYAWIGEALDSLSLII